MADAKHGKITKPGKPNFKWRCRRMGGTDQVTLSTMAELRHLRELDPKLWGALSCPVAGLEFDRRALSLLDADGDGRIRMAEVLSAVEWFCARVNDTANITGNPQAMPLAAIADETEAGKRLLATARIVLNELNSEADEVTPEDVAKVLEIAAEQAFNGDGVLPPLPEMDDVVRDFVEAGLAIVGGAHDACGDAGLTSDLADALYNELKIWQTWRTGLARAPQPVADTDEAWRLLEELRAKIDDYFLRCSLAAFAPQAEGPLNADEQLLALAEKADIDQDTLAALPLSRVRPDADLALDSGLNPIWRERVERFAELIRPRLANPNALGHEEWLAIQKAFAPYGEALAARPAVGVYEEGAFVPPEDPAAAIDALGPDGVKRLLTGGVRERFQALCVKDLASGVATEDIAELERLVLYYCHLHRLLMNFVSFHDFYSLRPDVTFRAGTLYIDGRSCRLCVQADDPAAHSKLAAMSRMCLLYCECKRRGEGEGPATRAIMAALTEGDDDVLVEGRNGVFVDNTGQDWDAALVKIVHNPISVRQAMWAPYKRVSQLVGGQVAKFAADRNAQALDAAKSAADDVAAAAKGKAPAQPFDMGKSVGIFAAVGIALGAIGTAVGSIVQALFSLSWWQFPLLLVGIFLVISGPSVFLAWLKFRKRTLGPILEASGWAVNTQLPVSLKLGAALTDIAQPPANIERQSALDPFLDKKSHAGFWFFLLILLAALGLGAWLWQSGRLDGVMDYVRAKAPAASSVLPQGDAPGAGKKTE